MYPDEQTLMEVGRIAIAAGRLDAGLGALWYQLAPDEVDELRARRAPAGTVRGKIEILARERLDNRHRDALLAFVEEVKDAQTQRNAVMHSQWLLRGPDAMRPVSEFLALNEEERAAYIEQLEREARRSDGWRRQPNDSMELTAPQQLDELIALERRLTSAVDIATSWRYRIASMRVAGSPPGWQGPTYEPVPQPLPPGATTGPAAIAQMESFIQRMVENRAANDGENRESLPD
jgi:hypothetical protein